MKRSLLLVVAVTLAFGACQKKNETTEEATPAVETTPAAAPMDTTAAPATMPAESTAAAPATTPATTTTAQ